jgi:hypothetical protein
MKRTIVALCVAAGLAAAAAVPCMAVGGSPWNGFWKLNQDKSTLTGETFTITEAGGKMHYSNGATISYDFACDGQPYTVISDSTSAWVRNSATSYDMIYTIRGADVSVTHREISADGKTLTATTNGMSADGRAITDLNIFTRLSGGPGIVGKWKNVESRSTPPKELFIGITPPDGIEWIVSGSLDTLVGKMDGKPLAMLGDDVPDGVTYSFKMGSALKITYEVKLKDKTMAQGEQVLSADGKVLTDTSWVMGKPMEKEVDVYDKE